MRRAWVGICCLLVFGAADASAAEDTGKADVGPSLEYRPPKPILPEPKGPTPAPRVAVFRESFGNFGIGRGSFHKPRDVAFGVEGRVYVLDAGNGRVQLFDKSNNFLLEWGSTGSDERRCQFRDPSAIYVVPGASVDCSPQGIPTATGKCEVVLVLDTGNDRIQWFKVPITRDPQAKLPNLPCGHASSVFNAFLPPRDVESCGGSNSNKVVGDFGYWGESGISENAKFNRPLDIAFEGEGVAGSKDDWLIFRVLDAGNERILRFKLTFECANNLCFPSASLFGETIGNLTGDRGNLTGLVSLALSREESFDYLYLLGTGCSIQKFKFGSPLSYRTYRMGESQRACTNPSVSTLQLDTVWPAVAPESGLCVPERVRFDRNRKYVYVLDSGNSILATFHRSGNFISALRGADRIFDEPGGFDFKPESGEFVLADTGNDVVQKFTLR